MTHFNKKLAPLVQMNKIILVLGVLCIPFLISCIKTINPYTISEANIVLAETSMIQNGSTFLAGSNLSLTLYIELKDFLDKVILSAPGNDSVLWVDTSIAMNSLTGSILSFKLRYHTSGQKQIRFDTYYKDGRMKVTTISLSLTNYSDTIPPLARIVERAVYYTISNTRDTIYSINDSLPLQLLITDANSKLDFASLTIDNAAFDEVDIRDTSKVYVYKSFDMATVSSPKQIEISAKDIHGNTCNEIYWIRKQ